MTTTEHTAPAAAGANPLKSAAERIALVRAGLDRLRAENQRLQADVERLTRERDDWCSGTALALKAQEQAEIERDAMRARIAMAERMAEAARTVIAAFDMASDNPLRVALAAWEASRG
ncbi:conserved protein of unknown function (plasmid) [Rhodovastum atsumiense]|uniref:Uncharacterized protein n=1 Tax=Rhodovastum atsumiense TaxID=504468 RepID=A0A5M6IMZ5_9PROT|nr:hypothetical protein [Rhodovastum atsumiense]KAA5609622.1 hypothetical protein F1189_22940 [Rhodovastum atsumiense]CAH2606483.1 conserved protein of unknown function [Rhodovastum atsumiense]